MSLRYLHFLDNILCFERVTSQIDLYLRFL